MLTEKEILSNFIQKQKDCEFSLRFALRKETGVWKNCFALLQLVKKEKRLAVTMVSRLLEREFLASKMG